MSFKHKNILAGIIAATASIGSAYGEDQIQLTVVHDSPPNHVTVTHGIEPWMACVKDKVQDRVSFKYYPGGQLAKNREMLKAMNSGIADMAPVPVGYVSDKMPLNTVGMLPALGASSSEELVSAYSEAIQSGALAKELDANDIVPLWIKLDPPYQVLSTKGPLRSLDDFKGKVIRSSGGAVNFIIEALGSSPAEISVGDTYMALERGTVDGALTFLTSIKPYSMHELMNALSTNADLGSFPLVFAIRKDRWASLPADIQGVMTNCGAQTEQSMAEYTDQLGATLAKEFAAQGVEVYQFTDAELAAMNEHLVSVQEDWVSRLAGRGLPAEEVLADFKSILNGK